MIRRIVSKLTYANVAATIALFLALGAGSFSVASHLKVRSSDIAKNAVRAKHIKKNQVRAKQIGRIVPRSRGVSVGPGETATVRAQCRRGEQVISGGGVWGLGADHSVLRIVQSSRTGRGWLVTGANGHASEAIPLLASTSCLRR